MVYPLKDDDWKKPTWNRLNPTLTPGRWRSCSPFGAAEGVMRAEPPTPAPKAWIESQVADRHMVAKMQWLRRWVCIGTSWPYVLQSHEELWGGGGEASLSTYIPRVLQCLSPHQNWDPTTPSPARECIPPTPEPQEGEHTRLRVRGWGSPYSDD